MREGRDRAVAALRAGGLAAIIVGCTAGPIEPGRAAPSLEASAADDGVRFEAEADGVRLTVHLDRPEVQAAETATFTVTLTNERDDPLMYAGSPCRSSSVELTLSLPSEPYGRQWDGIAGEFKDYVLGQGMRPGIVPAFGPLQVQARGPRCGGSPEESALAPGESVTTSHPWVAELSPGVPALPGPVTFVAFTGYDRQDEPPSDPPDGDGPTLLWLRSFKPIVVEAVIDIGGASPALLGPGEVLDGLLSDETFANWLAEQPADTWGAANMFLAWSGDADGSVPQGSSWEIDLFREIGVPRHWAIAFVDPFDGTLGSVTYCDIPCDR